MKTLVILIALMLGMQEAQAFSFFNVVKNQEALPLFQNVTLEGFELGYQTGGKNRTAYNFLSELRFKTQDDKIVVVNMKERLRSLSYKASDKITLRVMKVETTEGQKLNCLSKIIINQEEVFVTQDGCNEVTIK